MGDLYRPVCPVRAREVRRQQLVQLRNRPGPTSAGQQRHWIRAVLVVHRARHAQQGLVGPLRIAAQRARQGLVQPPVRRQVDRLGEQDVDVLVTGAAGVDADRVELVEQLRRSARAVQVSPQHLQGLDRAPLVTLVSGPQRGTQVDVDAPGRQQLAHLPSKGPPVARPVEEALPPLLVGVPAVTPVRVVPEPDGQHAGAVAEHDVWKTQCRVSGERWRGHELLRTVRRRPALARDVRAEHSTLVRDGLERPQRAVRVAAQRLVLQLEELAVGAPPVSVVGPVDAHGVEPVFDQLARADTRLALDGVAQPAGHVEFRPRMGDAEADGPLGRSHEALHCLPADRAAPW